MTHDQNNPPISDETLVAYLDDALSAAERRTVEEALGQDPEIADRLAELDRGMSIFERARDDLDAFVPSQDILEAQLDAAFEEVERRAAASPFKAVSALWQGRTPEWWLMAASIVVAFTLGVFIHDLFRSTPVPAPMTAEGPPAKPSMPPVQPSAPVEPKPRGWKKAIADYAVLYSRATIANKPTEPKELSQNLTTVEAGLGRPMALDTLQVAGFDLLQAELLDFNGNPLAQVIYRDGDGNPVLFCIIKSAKSAQTKDPAAGSVDALNTYAWDKAGYGYVVIGDVSEEVVRQLGDALVPNFF